MKYRYLGLTGLSVSELCLGTMMFGAWGNPDHDECVTIVRRSLDAGINFIDTADAYSGGAAESMLGKAIAGRRDDVVIATKLSFSLVPPGPESISRWLTRQCDQSLQRLGTDRIDLYQLHRPPTDNSIDEILEVLTKLVRQGKIRHLGSSSLLPSQCVELAWAAGRAGAAGLASEQASYSLLVRGVEAELLPVCEKYDVAVLARSPLAGGWLSGKWRKGAWEVSSSRIKRHPGRYDIGLPANRAKLDAADALAHLADAAGLSLVEMAIAFALQHPAVSSTIIGPRTLEHLTGQLPAVGVTLGTELLDRIDEIVVPGTNFSWADAAFEPQPIASAPCRRRS
jgi:aryl-alcohol dehydrogenase-like predicted oxidoreductase